MKKALLLGGAVVGLIVGGKRLARNCGGFDFEKMIERMPEDAPPKWMFRNISAIRSNTEQILALLESTCVATSEKARTAA